MASDAVLLLGQQLSGFEDGKSSIASSGGVPHACDPSPPPPHGSSSGGGLAAAGTDALGRAVTTLWHTLSSGQRTLHALAYVLHGLKLGRSVRIRHSGGGGAGDVMSPRLRHSYILIDGFVADGFGPTDLALAVDPFFREQFFIGGTDPEYSSFLINEVPEVFVGPPSLMRKMLGFICTMMREAMGRLQMGLPPWRQTDVVFRKWFPRSFTDEVAGPHFAALLAASPGVSTTHGSALAKTQSKAPAGSAQRPAGARARRRPDQPRAVIIGFDLTSGQQQQGRDEGRSGKGEQRRAPIGRQSSDTGGALAHTGGPGGVPATPASLVRSLSSSDDGGWRRTRG